LVCNTSLFVESSNNTCPSTQVWSGLPGQEAGQKHVPYYADVD
jgi:hypothetical protein